MKNKNDNNTNIFQGAGLLTECVREWDKQLRLNEWVDTDVFADVFHFATIHYEKEEAYKQEIKDAKPTEEKDGCKFNLSFLQSYKLSHNLFNFSFWRKW